MEFRLNHQVAAPQESRGGLKEHSVAWKVMQVVLSAPGELTGPDIAKALLPEVKTDAKTGARSAIFSAIYHLKSADRIRIDPQTKCYSPAG